MDPRSRFTRAATCTAFCLVIAAALSCRANPVSKTRPAGPAALEIAVGGVVPPAPSRSPRAARSVPGISPAILPMTATIRVVVEDEDGDQTTVSSAYTGAGTVSVGDLPAEEALSVEVAALNAAGEVVTSWTGTVELEEGQNALTATLAPPTSAVTSLPTTTVSLGAVTLASSVNLGAGGVAFYRIPLDCAAGGEYQIIYDTGKARWAWMGAYDDSWLPLQVVCSDQAQGWVVVSVPAGVATTVNIALSNSVSSPGYPAGSMTGALQARHAVFMVPGGTGSGTSADPSGAPRVSEDGQSGFARAGDVFTASGSTNFDLTGDMRVYGGFSADWKSRSGRTAMGSTSTAVSTVQIVAGSGCLDGLSISGPSLANTTAATGLSLQAIGPYVVNDCSISGNVMNTALSSYVESTGMAVLEGPIEIASCTISGGIARSDIAGADTRGIYSYVESGSAFVYLHQCDIDGGTVFTSAGEASINAYALYAQGSAEYIVAGCRVWGGSARNTGDPGSATSRGLHLDCDLGYESAVANCLVSGGYAEGQASMAIGVEKTGYAGISGCTIDSGRAVGTTYQSAYSIDEYTADAPEGTVMVCALFSSTGTSTPPTAALNLNSASGGPAAFIANGIFSFEYELNKEGNPEAIASNIAGTEANTLSRLLRTPAEEFAVYTTPTTFAQFLANDWHAATEPQVISTSSGGTPAEWGVDPSLFTTYPALGFDLAGNARGYNTVWNRGAYQ